MEKKLIFENARAAFFKEWPDANIPSKHSVVGNKYVWLDNVNGLLAKYNYRSGQFVEISKQDEAIYLFKKRKWMKERMLQLNENDVAGNVI